MNRAVDKELIDISETYPFIESTMVVNRSQLPNRKHGIVFRTVAFDLRHAAQHFQNDGDTCLCVDGERCKWVRTYEDAMEFYKVGTDEQQ